MTAATATSERAPSHAPGAGEPRIESVAARVFTVPLEEPESDGTLTWDATTAVVVLLRAGGREGLGYTYGDSAVAALIESKLADVVTGARAGRPAAINAALQHELRNAGRPGIGAMAISAVDIAAWDLKARLDGLPLADVLPRFHERVPVYGSGGFTSYSEQRLTDELRGWLELGIPRVKIKVGRAPEQDPERLALARETIGGDVALFVDANGAFSPQEALRWARAYAEFGVSWFEEPVSSEDRAGLLRVRDRAPAGMAIAAGEYEWGLPQLDELSRCVDVLQADVTRCGGITNLLRFDGICRARNLPSSAHCAPAISAHACTALETLAHLEYFADHVRAEGLLFDGVPSPDDGYLRPDPAAAGHGLSLSERAREYES
jgi:L-alanine-DL-glutamate epimerase-like enolase superfamily enzyme